MNDRIVEPKQDIDEHGIRARVIDAYSLKPIDEEALHQAAQVTGGRLMVVEDHFRGTAMRCC